ncbi:hypothetical protein [Streptomyces cucumeris]|uniref:hypothetical protein n=1 Tax=Streptomyces cucumeris TaxID=2962890 RepID=UPI0020C88EA6|nr:hypothetical protein [Streptomyces sp. NEAU-Y11]MCP9209276.1 hypothetical protein [Streptomyces sp. NEAU-Y11]
MTFAPRTWNAGETVTDTMLNTEVRDQFNEMFAAWTSYTPAWTAATTNPVLGNGTLAGRYLKVGRTCTAHINLITGSTTTYGAGNYAWALPFAAANAGCSYVGHAHLLAGTRWMGQTVISPAATTASPFFPTNSTTTTASFLQPTVPVTLASGHQLRMTFTYETAS